MWWLLLDVLFLLLFAGTIFLAAKRGFFKTMISLAAYVLSLIGAKVLSTALAPQVYDRFFAARLHEEVASRLQPIAPNDYMGQFEAAFDALPRYVNGLMQLLGISNESVTDTLSHAQLRKTDMVENVMTNFVSPVTTAVIRMILFAVIAFVLSVVLRIVGELLIRVIKHLPVIKQIDTGLGVVLGVIRGVLIVLLVALCLDVLAGMVNSPAFLEAVDQSKVESVVRGFLNSISGYVAAKGA